MFAFMYSVAHQLVVFNSDSIVPSVPHSHDDWLLQTLLVGCIAPGANHGVQWNTSR
jgi:hypothetical protein